MARPSKNDIDSGIQNWDGKIDDNDEVLFNGPLPIHQHAGDESDLAATFAAAAYDRCSVWVDHTTLGWSLYVSNGTAWVRMLAAEQRPAIVDLTNSTGGTGNDTLAAISGSGDDATINDNFSDLADKLAEVTAALRNHGLIQ